MNIEKFEALVNPNEEAKARFQRDINNMLQASADIRSIGESIQESMQRGFELISDIERLRLENPDDPQIETNLVELAGLTKTLVEKSEELLRDQAQETIGQMSEQEDLADLEGKISDDELRAAETQARDAENKCQEDGMMLPMLALAAAIMAQMSDELRGQQDEPGHDATPLSQMTVDQQFDAINDDCTATNFSTMRAKQEMIKRDPLIKSAMDSIAEIDKALKVDRQSKEGKAMAAQLFNSTEQFPAYAQDITIFIAEAVASSNEAQLRFDAVKDKLVPIRRNELEGKVKQAADAVQEALANASFTATVLRLMRHASIMLQEQLASP